MAEHHTINVENYLLSFGGEPTNKWGEMTWGSSNWGTGDHDLVTNTGKLITNSEALIGATNRFDSMKLTANSEALTGASNRFDTMKLYANAQASTTALIFDVMKLIANSEAVTGASNRFDTMKLYANAQPWASSLYFATHHKVDMGNFVIVTNEEYQYLTSGDWNYIFQGGVANADDRESTTYSEASPASTSWTSVAQTSTSWTGA